MPFNPYRKLRSLFEDTPERILKIVIVVWSIGFLLRLLISFTNQGYTDYADFRLPIARSLAEGELLYRDVPYNHMPVYPYLSAFMYLISPDDPVITSAFIRFPMVLFDSLVPLGIVMLMRSLHQVRIGIWASVIYALNPISIYEIGLSHWDGMASFFVIAGLAAIINDRMERTGFLAGLGFTIKQFPLVILLFGTLYTRNIKKIGRMILFSAVITAIIIGPFLVLCPIDFLDGILGHSVHSGTGSQKVLVGTVAGVFENIGVPYGKPIWAVLFTVALIVPMFRVKPHNIVSFAGLTFVMLSIFFYVTHRQMIVWLLPFVFILVAKDWRISLVPALLLGLGYLIRVIKPDWYWGIVILISGVWFYIIYYWRLTSPPSVSE